MNKSFNKTYTASLAIVAFLFLSSAFGFPWDSAPKNEISWSDNLRQAQELSRQTGKPVLVHFYSDTCPPCKMMEKNTFPNPEISATVKNSFIPVKLNANRNPREAQMFNVQGVPMDIVLSPNGQPIEMAVGGQDASRYSQFLATALGKMRPQQPAPQVPAPAPQTPDFPAPPIPEPPTPNNPPVPPQPNIEAGGACPINETPSFDYASIPEEDRARIEFEGYCPVELGQNFMWVRGDYNNRLVFEDRLYLFAGKAQLEEFRRNPEKYAPAYQGIDIVVWKERGEKVHGIRNYGAWAVGRVFLFSSEENLSKFEKNARYYLTPNKN
ncbi:MAG: thioredoxin fold domain-containing protein [Thermoguttaceae bacterium]|nr:thioredoxin fold domain-containing protein [Thermoguttaceae bacterium]